MSTLVIWISIQTHPALIQTRWARSRTTRPSLEKSESNTRVLRTNKSLIPLWFCSSTPSRFTSIMPRGREPSIERPSWSRPRQPRCTRHVWMACCGSRTEPVLSSKSSPHQVRVGKNPRQDSYARNGSDGGLGSAGSPCAEEAQHQI
ncbi:hypothetical protein FOCG_00477 [Fusarium oxysporum f. sp. radicis-lycopersici 26381]|uniref:Uncharacterized protein n=1 Tax=Fusarium oxysporum Fo47 TaxID=660027 RepID=W9KS22_FUSOX|nr:hypothetical protein FOZG_04974 [Fusarium oxysporum Fo47]EWZ99146.1 hypothetical protein FOWG_02910 [Fusarium oxysporum f. sp. lycopersici MN25]EXL61313.1 hypothetical protein FOCG_00477 [Fusarium oxysporum f. sp. radicis-lycopersici 26381]